MNRISTKSPIVGAYFRPPAKQVLASLPSGCQLVLVAEPDNPYDAAAIKVLVGLDQVPEGQYEELERALDGTGTSLGELLERDEPLHLGYVISAGNKKLGSWDSNEAVAELLRQGACQARLGFGPDGQPLVLVNQEPEL